MKIGNLVRTDFEVIAPEVLVSDLMELLTKKTYLVVKEQDRFLGILSSHQPFQDINLSAGQCLIELPRIDFDTETSEVCKIMQRHGQVTVPVFDHNDFVGVVSLPDIVSSFSEYYNDQNTRLETLKRNKEEHISKLNVELEEYRELIRVFTHYKESIEKILKTKSDLLADVSHEVRNPLQIILSYSRQGLRKVDKDRDELIYRYFSRINDAGEKMLILVDDLLDLSKLEAGKNNYEFEACGLSELVEIVLEEYQLILESKQITSTFKKPLDSDITNMDRNRILQVIRNLVSNAFKFSPDEGQIRIEVDVVEKDIRFTIIDWGFGIPANEFGELFTKYTRTSQPDIEGTGLGLSIAFKIINDHQGQIYAKPNPEGGSIFTFTLPITDR